MNPDLDTLATALYVTVDDLLVAHPEWAPLRPAVGIAPELSDAELVTLAVLQPLLGFDSEARFVRYAKEHLTPWFPYLPERAGYNKRLRRSGELMAHVLGALARDCPSWYDDVWVVDSTPVECGRSRETQKRSERPGWATYGYSASHSRYFWGLRLHLLATPSGLPIAYALAGAKVDERDVCLDMIAHAGVARRGQTLIADKGYRSAAFEAQLNDAGIALIRPATKSEPTRPGSGSCGRCARSSSPSSRPSKPNSASNATARAPAEASPHESNNDSSPSPPPSGTTKPPTDPAPPAPCSPTTTDPLELLV